MNYVFEGFLFVFCLVGMESVARTLTSSFWLLDEGAKKKMFGMVKQFQVVKKKIVLPCLHYVHYFS